MIRLVIQIINEWNVREVMIQDHEKWLKEWLEIAKKCGLRFRYFTPMFDSWLKRKLTIEAESLEEYDRSMGQCYRDETYLKAMQQWSICVEASSFRGVIWREVPEEDSSLL